jgi:hypothetical protein
LKPYHQASQLFKRIIHPYHLDPGSAFDGIDYRSKPYTSSLLHQHYRHCYRASSLDMATTSTSRSAHPFASQPQDIRSRTQTGVSTSSSQMLPSITCSSCGVSIQMDDLGSHVCQPGKSYNSGSNPGPGSTSSYTASRANLPPSDSFRGKGERQVRRPYDHQHQYQDQQYQHQHQYQQPQQKDRDRDRGLKLDMSQLRPPDTSGFLAAGDSGMAGVGRRGFGGEPSLFYGLLRYRAVLKRNLF